MSTWDRSRLALLEEVTWGTTPAAAGQLINVESPGLAHNKELRSPSVLRGDRQKYAPVVLSQDGTLSLAAPYQYANNLAAFEGAMGDDEEADYGVSGTGISFDATANTINDTGSGLGGFNVGDSVRVAGSTSNDGWHGVITSVAAGSLGIDEKVGSALVEEVAGASITLSGKRMVNGIVDKSYSGEIEYQDLASNFRGATGLKVSRFTRTWTVADFATEGFEMIGNRPAFSNATIFTGAPTAAPTSPFMSTLSSNLTEVGVAGIAGLELSRFELTVNTGARGRRSLGGATGFSGINLGTFEIQVAIDFYFDAAGRSLFDSFDATTESLLYIATSDGTNHELLVLPSCYGSGDQPSGNPDQDVTGSVTYIASAHSTYGWMLGRWGIG